jgi:hypothetical protein
MDRLAAMNSVDSSASSVRLPIIGTPNNSMPVADDQRRLDEADEDIRHDLAEHDLDRRDRHRSRLSMVPRSIRASPTAR